MPSKIIEKFNPKDLRKTLGLNQQAFWSQVGVTQSGGSRYESGRSMPHPVRELVRLVFIEGIRIREITKEDQLLLDHLKKDQPDLYKSLKQSLGATLKQAA